MSVAKKVMGPSQRPIVGSDDTLLLGQFLVSRLRYARFVTRMYRVWRKKGLRECPRFREEGIPSPVFYLLCLRERDEAERFAAPWRVRGADSVCNLLPTRARCRLVARLRLETSAD